MKSIIRHDGLRGLYRGLGPTILGYLPTWAIYFAVYDGIKTRYGEAPLGVVQVAGKVYPAAQVKGYQPVMREHPWSLHIFSAMAAGACSTIATNPLWVIKTRFMVCAQASLREGSSEILSRPSPETKVAIDIRSTHSGQYGGRKDRRHSIEASVQVYWESHMWLSSFLCTKSLNL